MDETIQRLENWIFGHKRRWCKIGIKDGYGACCWHIELHDGKNENGTNKVIHAAEVNFLTPTSPDVVYVQDADDETDPTWPGLAATINAALNKAEENEGISMKKEYKEELEKQKKEIENKLSLFERFPDLHEYRGRWNNYLCSKKVNEIANEVEFRHSCGCCPDAVLYAMPYIKIEGNKIYSDPAQIGIGEKQHLGEKAWHSWKDKIKEQGCSEEVIKKIEKMFEENPPYPKWDENDDN